MTHDNTQAVMSKFFQFYDKRKFKSTNPPHTLQNPRKFLTPTNLFLPSITMSKTLPLRTSQFTKVLKNSQESKKSTFMAQEEVLATKSCVKKAMHGLSR
jgi:hypothetical protein